VAAHYLEAGRTIKPTDIVLKRTSADEVITDLSLVYQKTTKQGIQGNSVILPSYLD
jgi:hypothetical protein